MRIGFPCYAAFFTCTCPLDCAVGRIMAVVSDPTNNLNIIRSLYNGTQKMTLHSSTGSSLYFNSFAPEVDVSIQSTCSGSSIFLTFELQKSVKIFSSILCVYFLIALIRFACSPPSQLAPIYILTAMLLGTVIMPIFGLKRASKDVLEVLYTAVIHTDDNKPPHLRRYRKR